MKAVFGFVLGVLSTALLAMDPPYPTSTMDGYYLRGLEDPYKITFEPGTLESCRDNPQPTYTFYTCDVKGAELIVDTGTKKQKFIFVSLNAQETAGSASFPANMSYYFSGKFGTTLPDGSTFESDASLSFTRKLTEPDKLTGQVNVYTLGINAGLMMKWPGAAAPSPSPAPMPVQLRAR